MKTDLLGAIAALCLLAPAAVHAQGTGGVVVMTFTGDRAAPARNAVVNKLQSRLELLARDRLEAERARHTSESDPDSAACRAMGGRALVAGETVSERTGNVLRMRVRSCRTGRLLGEQVVPWRGRNLVPSALDAAIDRIVSAVESEEAPPPPPPLQVGPEQPPPPPQAEPEEEEPAAPPGEGWLEVGLMLRVASRSMEVDIDPENATEPPGSENTKLVYQGGAFLEGGIDASLYPLRLAGSEPRGLGLRARFVRSVAVKSQPLQSGEPAPDTTVEDFLAEAFWRIALGEGPAPVAIRFAVGWSRFAFVLDDNDHLPTFIYEAIRPSFSLYVPVSGPDLAVEAGAGTLLVSGLGDDAEDGLGPNEAMGIDFGLGVRGDLSGGLYWTVGGEYVSYSLKFESDRCAAEPCDPEFHRAGEGSDTYIRGHALLGYRFE